MDGSTYTDPVKVGPGLWFAIHTMAVKAVNEQLKEAFVTNINALCDAHRCTMCRTHMRKFLDSHSLKNYWHVKDHKGNDVGFFKFTWEMHNEVNRFLRKHLPTLEEAYNYYSDAEAGVCTDCGGVSATVAQPSVPPILELYLQHPNVIPKKPFLFRKK